MAYLKAKLLADEEIYVTLKSLFEICNVTLKQTPVAQNRADQMILELYGLTHGVDNLGQHKQSRKRILKLLRVLRPEAPIIEGDEDDDEEENDDDGDEDDEAEREDEDDVPAAAAPAVKRLAKGIAALAVKNDGKKRPRSNLLLLTQAGHAVPRLFDDATHVTDTKPMASGPQNTK